MGPWYYSVILIAALAVFNTSPVSAQGSCLGGSFQGDECTTDLDCNSCETFGGLPCSFFGEQCPFVGQTCSGGTQDGISCDGDGGFNCVLVGGGECVGGTPDTCGTAGVCVTASLPVELAVFTASVVGGDVVLNWTTASEVNNSGFAVEYSRSPSSSLAHWEELGFVEGNGTTQKTSEYQFRVSSLEVGGHRFRLKQLDYDGAFEYSFVVNALVEVPGEYVLEAAYPNPFNPATTIRFAVATEQQVVVTLSDGVGRTVRHLYRGTLQPDNVQALRIDGSGLASGTYQVLVVGERFSATEQITLLK